MHIYAAILDRDHVRLFETRNAAIIHAGDYWSTLPRRHFPVMVRYYDQTLYHSLRECQHAADLRLPWIGAAGHLIWKNGLVR